MSRSYIRAKVRLLRDAKTNGGTLFKAGTVMRVVDSTPHGLTLRCYKRGWHQMIRNVEHHAVTVLEWAPKKED